jgi:type VI protein secretion system component VasF
VEATIKTLATKDDLLNLRKDLGSDISALRKDFGNDISAIRKEMGENKAENIKWMFIFWIGQVGATLAIVFLFLKK